MNHYYVFDEFCLDTTNRRLFQKDVPVSLAPKSYELLELLISHPGEILKKEEILDSLWEENFVEEANLTQHIYLLRKALKSDDQDRVYIETFPKIGYRLTANVDELTGDRPMFSSPVYLPEDSSTETDFLPREQKTMTPEGTPSVSNRIHQFVKSPLSRSSAVLLILVALFTVFYNYYNYDDRDIENTRSESISSIAILPFRNIDGAKDQKLGSGLAETLVSRLGKMSHLRIRPAVSETIYTGNSLNEISEIGRNLNADAVLIGSIQCEGDLIRVVVGLYRVADNRQIWSETYDGRYSNLFALQDKISQQVSQKFSPDAGILTSR